MKAARALILIAILTTAALAQKPDQAVLQKLLTDDVNTSPTIPGEVLHITAPRQGVDISLAAGYADKAAKVPMDPHTPFRIASVTKTFTAASILRLYEDGKIKLDASIREYLPKEYIDLLRSGGYPVDAITVRHLLNHSSGIHDYGTDAKYYFLIVANPAHRWTRREQVESAVKWGKPHFEPGMGYHYSDTGYILLGEIIERLTGKTLGAAYRTLLNFDKLGLRETYLETLEPAPARVRPIGHSYYKEQDGVAVDASTDLYGGGGLVSTTDDLAIFFPALLGGKVYRNPSTLQTMMTIPASNQHGAYGMGITRQRFSGFECWGHTGFWGTSAFHCPEADVTLTRHYFQAEPDQGFFYMRVFNGVFSALGGK